MTTRRLNVEVDEKGEAGGNLQPARAHEPRKSVRETCGSYNYIEDLTIIQMGPEVGYEYVYNQ